MMLDPAVRQRIQSMLAGGDIAAAAETAEAALAAGARDPMLLNLAAWRREERGDYAEALRLLDQAWRSAPDDPLVAIAIGAVHRKMGEPERAMAIFGRLPPQASALAVYWLERGYALDTMGSYRAAHESFARATSLDASMAPAWAGMAGTAGRLGDWKVARQHAQRALLLDPDQVEATQVLASADLEEGTPELTTRRIRSLLGRPALSELDRIAALSTLGQALDRQGQHREAFAAFAEAQRRYRAHHTPRFGGETLDHRRLIERLTAEIETIDPASWDDKAECSEAAPVFLLGYPRSGTTLVETIIAGLPNTTTLEERPLFAESRDRFYTVPGGLQRLATARADELDQLRRAYWQRAHEHGVRSPSLLIDMDPMKSLYLPVIAKLFPHARLILMRRDPRDVVWSCFRHNFRISAVNYTLSDLEQAARHYDAMMQFIRVCLQRLPLAVHELRYEELVADFDGVTQALCSFLEQPWSPALQQFAGRAARRETRTASANQVRKGLFDGRAQWRPYSRELAPILPILRRWIECLSYSD